MNLPGLLFDIGGTKTRVAITHDGETLDSFVSYNTFSNYTDGLSALKKYVQEKNLSAVGFVSGGIAGPLNQQRDGIVNAPNLPNWNGRSLKKDLNDAFICEVLVENDTALVGLGEAVRGAGEDAKFVAYVTVSTGVNGVRVVDKKIDPSFLGYEIGKQIIDFDQTYMKGNFEDTVSGASLQARYKKLPSEIDDHVVWEEETRVLAVGLNNVAVFWSPEIIIVGGSVSEKIDISLLQRYFDKVLTIFPTRPKLRRATLQDKGGLYGAMQVARDL
ncbi:ROK family protein [Candidatus Microgenomates bacterium]|nr:MAG: ROK family protein [Candidatus Microgenomates bacterium]